MHKAASAAFFCGKTDGNQIKKIKLFISLHAFWRYNLILSSVWRATLKKAEFIYLPG